MALIKALNKILKENVLSGDFKIAHFKANIKEFLKFVASTFSLIDPTSDPSLLDNAVADVSSKLVASQFNKLKNPKSSRVYLCAVYAARVLGITLKSKEDIRDHLKSRYGSELVLAADSLDLGKSEWLDLTFFNVITKLLSTLGFARNARRTTKNLTEGQNGKR